MTSNWRPEGAPDASLVLDPASRVTHGCYTTFLLIFAILTNGAAWPAAMKLGIRLRESQESASGQIGSWAFGLFLLPFLALGIWLIWQTICSFATQWYPVPRIELGEVVRAEGGIRAGSKFPVRWTFEERAGLFRSLSVSVVGLEEVQTLRGTDLVTERSVFHRNLLIEGATSFRQGLVTVSIPQDAMPSFQARHNRIAWMLRMEGVPRVRFWPMMVREFVMIVEATSNS